MDSLLNELRQRKFKIAVIGLGYVGLPLAVAFDRKFSVIGFDSNHDKIHMYIQGIDPTEEIGNKAVATSGIEFTYDENKLKEAKFIVIAVPTPIHGDKTPDLTSLKDATKIVGRNLLHGSIVVYESTVYPGVTEEICCPILEKASGLKCGINFKVGYSPERINPGDNKHRIENITKIVSSMDRESLDIISSVYESIIDNVYQVQSIRVAEAAKLAENTQRDINIAFMNELSIIFHRMDIDTRAVLEAMNTKWNALGFQPGLVGGHCIGIDPYYFIYKAQNLGYHSQMISAGRHVNNEMSNFIVQEAIKIMLQSNIDVSRAKVYLMGMTFKENFPDTRNSRSVDIYRQLKTYGITVNAVDPLLNEKTFYDEYGIILSHLSDVKEADCLIFLVAHSVFRNLSYTSIAAMYRKTAYNNVVLLDIKSIFSRKMIANLGIVYWNL